MLNSLVSSRRFVICVAIVLLAVAGRTFAADVASEWQNDLVAALRANSAGDTETAEQIFLKALKETDKFPPGDARIGTTWNFLGLVFKTEQKYPRGREGVREGAADPAKG